MTKTITFRYEFGPYKFGGGRRASEELTLGVGDKILLKKTPRIGSLGPRIYEGKVTKITPTGQVSVDYVRPNSDVVLNVRFRPSTYDALDYVRVGGGKYDDRYELSGLKEAAHIAAEEAATLARRKLAEELKGRIGRLHELTKRMDQWDLEPEQIAEARKLTHELNRAFRTLAKKEAV